MTILYFDCFSGASGDMILGAMLDLGLPIEDLRKAVSALLPEGCDVAFERVVRGGITAGKFRLIQPHHEHAHRTVADILELVGRAAVSEAVRTKAARLFHRLAEVEAGVHGVPVDEIHLHEVGALDSIVDILGCAFAFESLGEPRIFSSALNVGSGTVKTAHGVLPVPAPATAALLKGVPVYSNGPAMEMVTPTGALVLTEYVEQFGPLPAMQIEKIAYGAGDRDPKGQANVLRILCGPSAVKEVGQFEKVIVVECEIDDMNPQIFGSVMDELLSAGALDVFYSPVQMKKNRPATLVTVIAKPSDREKISAILFRETTTIGLRYQEMDRERLDREQVVVDTPLGPVRFKVARRNNSVVNAAPEFEDCARLARERQLPLKDVQALAVKAYLESTGD